MKKLEVCGWAKVPKLGEDLVPIVGVDLGDTGEGAQFGSIAVISPDGAIEQVLYGDYSVREMVDQIGEAQEEYGDKDTPLQRFARRVVTKGAAPVVVGLSFLEYVQRVIVTVFIVMAVAFCWLMGAQSAHAQNPTTEIEIYTAITTVGGSAMTPEETDIVSIGWRQLPVQSVYDYDTLAWNAPGDTIFYSLNRPPGIWEFFVTQARRYPCLVKYDFPVPGANDTTYCRASSEPFVGFVVHGPEESAPRRPMIGIRSPVLVVGVPE